MSESGSFCCESCKILIDESKIYTFSNPGSPNFTGKMYCKACYDRIKIWIEQKRKEKKFVLKLTKNSNPNSNLDKFSRGVYGDNNDLA
jgi:hypothetical protein